MSPDSDDVCSDLQREEVGRVRARPRRCLAQIKYFRFCKGNRTSGQVFNHCRETEAQAQAAVLVTNGWYDKRNNNDNGQDILSSY